MERFFSIKFHSAVRILDTLACEWAGATYWNRTFPDPHSPSRGPRILTLEERNKIEEELGFVEGAFNECGLHTTGEAVNELRAELANGTYYANLNTQNVSARVAEIHRVARREMKTIVVLFIRPGEAQWYEQPFVFGDKVSEKFASAAEDISESGKCLALDRGTACVMHLSRVVESGLRALAKELGLPRRNDWGKHLDDIDKELSKRYKASGSRTDDEQFFSEAAAQIGHIKNAWRNPSMHVDRSYSPSRAHEILAAIRSFMQHLSTRLGETS